MTALFVSVLSLPVLGFVWFHFICRLMLHHRSCRNRARDVAGVLGLRFLSLGYRSGEAWLPVVERLEIEFGMLRRHSSTSARLRESMGGEVAMLTAGFYTADAIARLTGDTVPWIAGGAIHRMWLATATLAECVGEYQPPRRTSTCRPLATAQGC